MPLSIKRLVNTTKRHIGLTYLRLRGQEIGTMNTDPYDVHIMCAHASGADTIYVLADGTRAKPFFLYVGVKPPKNAAPTQFIGEVYQEITWQGLDANGHRLAELQVVRFNMTADHPDFGKLTISHDHSRPGTSATLRALQPGKKYPVVHTTRLHVTAVSSALPGVILQNSGPPLEFKSDPLSEWPPKDRIYKLQTVVNFEDRRAPGKALLSATDGAVRVGVTP